MPTMSFVIDQYYHRLVNYLKICGNFLRSVKSSIINVGNGLMIIINVGKQVVGNHVLVNSMTELLYISVLQAQVCVTVRINL